MSSFQILTILLGVLATGGGLLTLLKGLVEYHEQGKQKRATQFLDLRYRFVTNDSFSRIADLIDRATLAPSQAVNEELEKLPMYEKRRYVGFFEDVALAVHSNMIAPEVAEYMFGYYALACWNSHAFWSGNIGPKKHFYWALFALFCRDMELQRKCFRQRFRDDDYIRRTLRF